jgi:hypothetical protein
MREESMNDLDLGRHQVLTVKANTAKAFSRYSEAPVTRETRLTSLGRKTEKGNLACRLSLS